MKKSKITVLLILTLLSSSVFCQTIEPDSVVQFTKGWQVLDDPKYVIKYPPDWELSRAQQGVEFAVLSPLKSEEDRFRENVNLMVQDLAGMDINLDKYVEITNEQIKTMVISGQLWESERIKNDGDEFHQMVYSGKFGDFNLKFEQFIWIRSEKAYVLTLTCIYKEFYDYLPIGHIILDSFNLKVD